MNVVTQTGNPYVGLRPFEEKDSEFFFGRRTQIGQLLYGLHDGHFIAVVGSSGCGKSSLIRAGLVPALRGGFLVEQRDGWKVAVARPGGAPLRNLAEGLVKEFDPSVPQAEVDTLLAAIRLDHTQGLVGWITERLAERDNLLLLIDQFEEIFAFRGREEDDQLADLSKQQQRERALRRAEAADFASLIVELSQHKDLPIYTVLTMRTDFLGDCDLFYGLPEAMNRGRYLVPRLTREELRQAIQGPALLTGANLSPRLSDLLLNELGDRSDRLPVLQHALHRTWRLWHDPGDPGASSAIDVDVFRGAGALGRALLLDAEEALTECGPELRIVAERVFKCLTDTDSNQRRVRRPVVLQQLVETTGAVREQIEVVLDRFHGKGRSFIFTTEGTDNPRVDISHESLIRQWDRLRDWVDEERESRDRFLELAHAARRKASSWRGPDLAEALQWREQSKPSAEWARRYASDAGDHELAMEFLDRSRDEAAAEALASWRRKRNTIGGALLLLVLMTGTAIVMLKLWRTAETASERTLQNLDTIDEAETWLGHDSRVAGWKLVKLAKPVHDDVAKRASPLLVEVLERGEQGVRESRSRPVFASAISDDGLVVTGDRSGVTLWRADDGQSITSRRKVGPVLCVGFTPDGRRAYAGGKNGGLWCCETTAEERTFRKLPEVSAADVVALATATIEGQSWVATACADGVVTVSDPDGEAFRSQRIFDAAALCLAFSKSGERLVAGGADGSVIVWNWRTDQVTRLAKAPDSTAHARSVVTVSFGNDEFSVLTGSWDGQACIWNTNHPDSPEKSLPHERAVLAACWSNGGQLVLTGCEDGIVRLWRVGREDEATRLTGQGDPVVGVSFLPRTSDASGPPSMSIVASTEGGDTRLLTVTYKDHEVTSERVIKEHQGAVMGASISPDGSRLVTFGEDGTTRAWRPLDNAEAERLAGLDFKQQAQAFRNGMGSLPRTAAVEREFVFAAKPGIEVCARLVQALLHLPAAAVRLVEAPVDDAQLAKNRAAPRAERAGLEKIAADATSLRKEIELAQSSRELFATRIKALHDIEEDALSGIRSIAVRLLDPSLTPSTADTEGLTTRLSQAESGWRSDREHYTTLREIRGKQENSPETPLDKKIRADLDDLLPKLQEPLLGIGEVIRVKDDIAAGREVNLPGGWREASTSDQETMALQTAVQKLRQIHDSMPPPLATADADHPPTPAAVLEQFRTISELGSELEKWQLDYGTPKMAKNYVALWWRSRMHREFDEFDRPRWLENVIEPLRKDAEVAIAEVGRLVSSYGLRPSIRQRTEYWTARDAVAKLDNFIRDMRRCIDSVGADDDDERKVILRLSAGLEVELPDPPQPQSPDHWDDRARRAWPMDHGTRAQRELIEWHDGYWRLRGRDIDMVLVQPESTPWVWTGQNPRRHPAPDAPAFLIDKHEVTFREFLGSGIHLRPGAAKDYWDRLPDQYRIPAEAETDYAMSLYGTAIEVAAAFARDACSGVALAILGSRIHLQSGAARDYLDLEPDKRRGMAGADVEPLIPHAMLLFGASMEVAEAFARDAYPGLALTIPTHNEWTAAWNWNEQRDQLTAIEFKTMCIVDLKRLPRVGQQAWDSPDAGIHGMRSGVSEWVQINNRCAPCGLSLFRPWTGEVATGRSRFDGSSDYFDDRERFLDSTRLQTCAASRSEDAYGFRCVFRLDPYQYDEAGK